MSTARIFAFLAPIVFTGCASGAFVPAGASSDGERGSDSAAMNVGDGTAVRSFPGFDRNDGDDTGDTEEPKSEDVFGAYELHVAPDGNAARYANEWRSGNPRAASFLDQIASQPIALWLGDWNHDVTNTVDRALDAAGNKLQVLVVYNIPHRDCGAWSSGGAADASEYGSFVGKVAAGIAGRKTIVVLEPDALPLTHCLSAEQKADRFAMMSAAVDTLTAAGASVYLDAGDSNWIRSGEISEALKAAGVSRAAGFSLNVSHTERESDEMAFAEEIRAIVGPDAHYIIDSSRSGVGPTEDNQWCNPLGRALGTNPTVKTGIDGLDGLFWIKPPGDSDGSCNGGPIAGAFWPEYAVGLAEVASKL